MNLGPANRDAPEIDSPLPRYGAHRTTTQIISSRLFPRLLVLVTVSGLSAACNMRLFMGGDTKAWIDSPRDRSRHPLAPLEIVMHSADKAGIDLMELYVNGEQQQRWQPSRSPNGLFTARQIWEPAEPGNYVLHVRARGLNGAWSESASVLITIFAETPTPTSTATPTITATGSMTTTAASTQTPSATSTISPTATPTLAPASITPSLTPVPPDTTFPTVSISHSPPGTTFYTTTTLTFSATASDNVGVVKMEIYASIGGESSGPVKVCSNTSACTYQSTFPDGWLTYQARAYDAAGNQGGTWPTTIHIIPVVR